MAGNTFKMIFVAGWVLYMFGLYTPSARRFRRAKIIREHTRAGDAILDFTVFIFWQVFPLIFAFSSWLEFADYSLADWAGWIGVIFLAGTLLVLFPAYRTLGENWSPKIDLREGQGLITKGLYSRVRHPIYAGMWLWGFSNLLMLHNWVAGPGFLLTFALLYAIRMPREEAMMVEHFGDAYREYMARTGRVFPKKSE